MRVEIAPYQSENYNKSLEIRNEILRKPLGMAITQGDIYDEDKHVHFVAFQDNEVVGCVVLIPQYQPAIGKLRQMATLEKVRGQGHGKLLVEVLEQYAKSNGMSEIVLHSRYHAVKFYEKMGYVVCSEVFQEVGIDHYKMSKKLL